MIYKVGISGITGRVGREIASLLADGFSLGGDTFELSDGIARGDGLLSVEGVAVRKVAEPEREPVHVWIDFSRPEGTLALLERIETPVVIGTTGFSPDQLRAVQAYAQKAPVLLCPNTSPGMGAMTTMLRAGRALSALGFEAHLSEDHHRHKVDSPSGTAKHLTSVLEESGFKGVPVQVTRAGSIVGTHTVRFIADGEELVVQHRVTDRRIFARGAVVGAAFVLGGKKSGLFTFDQALEPATKG